MSNIVCLRIRRGIPLIANDLKPSPWDLIGPEIISGKPRDHASSSEVRVERPSFRIMDQNPLIGGICCVPGDQVTSVIECTHAVIQSHARGRCHISCRSTKGGILLSGS